MALSHSISWDVNGSLTTLLTTPLTRRTEEFGEHKQNEVSYLTLSAACDGFTRVLGKGAFGTVYLGTLFREAVAVKRDNPMHSSSTPRGGKEWQQLQDLMNKQFRCVHVVDSKYQ